MAIFTSRGIVVVVATLVARAIPGKSFVDHKPSLANCRASELNVFDAFSATRDVSLPSDDESVSTNRRTALLTGVSLAAGYFCRETIVSNTSPAILSTLESTMEPSIEKVATVEQALSIIESRGDKRFLHAVVASDYNFLYEHSTKVPSEMDVQEIFSKTGSTSAVQYELACTGRLRTKNAKSLWPLENDVHYAWPEQGGLLERSQSMIVDGIDCGKMSLEDALEGDMQVLVQAPTYLVVPSHMEASLRKGLQEAFLI